MGQIFVVEGEQSSSPRTNSRRHRPRCRRRTSFLRRRRRTIRFSVVEDEQSSSSLKTMNHRRHCHHRQRGGAAATKIFAGNQDFRRRPTFFFFVYAFRTSTGAKFFVQKLFVENCLTICFRPNFFSSVRKLSVRPKKFCPSVRPNNSVRASEFWRSQQYRTRIMLVHRLENLLPEAWFATRSGPE